MTIGIRELARNTSRLNDYDYLEVKDRKTHKLRGLFVSPKYADEIKEYLDKKKQKEIQEKLDALRAIIPLPESSLTKKSIQSIKSDMGSQV